jgi:hypothetical protein
MFVQFDAKIRNLFTVVPNAHSPQPSPHAQRKNKGNDALD